MGYVSNRVKKQRKGKTMGIDYGFGKTNIDTNGIRYGVIPVNEVLQAWCDESEAYYGAPHCPECGNELDHDVCDGHTCDCGYEIKWVGDECYGDEPISHYVDDSDLTAESDSHGDIVITKSPYYTTCGFCSPCAPGAGYLMDRGDDCKAYCFGPDWFDGECPYPVYRVSDNSLVKGVYSG